MDSRQRFVLIYAVLAMILFPAFTFLNASDLGIFVSVYAIKYFALKLILNPKMRFKIDLLELILIGLFVYFIVLRVAGILGVSLP